MRYCSRANNEESKIVWFVLSVGEIYDSRMAKYKDNISNVLHIEDVDAQKIGDSSNQHTGVVEDQEHLKGQHSK